jgi:2-polyprenyl-3-methyl-5-hydroxy-6-metoxy-1,4-benzoquinol methylase
MKEYDYSHQYFEQGMVGWHQQSFKTITSLFDFQFMYKEIPSILDFGSGDGFYGAFLNNYSANVDGFDISDELSSSNNKKFYRKFKQLDLAGPIDCTEKYKVLFSTEVIEHVLDYKRFLRNARMVTEKDGFLFLTTTTFAFSIFVYLVSFPTSFKFKEIGKYFSGLFGNERNRTAFLNNIWSWTKGHYHGFSKRQMKNALAETGWEVISIKFMKVQPLIYNQFFLNPFNNVRLRFPIIFFARILYGVTVVMNWVVKITGVYSSNIVVVAKNSAA